MGTGMNFKSEKKEEKPKESEKMWISPTMKRESMWVIAISTLSVKRFPSVRSWFELYRFDYAVENAKMDADRRELKVSVKNIGKVAGVKLYNLCESLNGDLTSPPRS